MLTPLDGISLRQFAMIALKKISFPRMKIIGLKRSENVEKITEKRVIRRGMSSNDQDTMKLILKQKEIEDEIPHSIGYCRIHLIRAKETYFVKVEVQQEVWTELSFEGSPLLKYHLGFECDKGSIILMGRRDLTLCLIKDRILQERPACVVCQMPKMECEVFIINSFPFPPFCTESVMTGGRKQQTPSKRLHAKLQTKRDLNRSSAHMGKTASPQRIKTKRPIKRGNGALERHQRTADLLIPKMLFRRVVREVIETVNKENNVAEPYRIQSLAVDALQEAAEAFLTSMFEDANMAAIHGRRATVMTKDLDLVRRIRREHL